MPNINFKSIPALKPRYEYEFRLIPDGWYLAEIIKITPEFQPSGVERWTILWVTLGGEYKEVAVKDWLHWGDEDDGPRSEQALARCKVVCKAIGIDVEAAGSVDIKPENLIGGIAHIKTKQRPDRIDKAKKYVNIEHDGFKAATKAEISNIHAEAAKVAMGLAGNREPGDDDIPF